MTGRKEKEVQVASVQRRRRWSSHEKLAMVRETCEPGMSVSLVARSPVGAVLRLPGDDR